MSTGMASGVYIAIRSNDACRYEDLDEVFSAACAHLRLIFMSSSNKPEIDAHSSGGMDPRYYAEPNEALQVRIPGDLSSVTYYGRVVSLSEGVLSMSWPTDRGIRLLAHLGDVLDFYFIREGIPYIFSGVIEKTESDRIPEITVRPDGPAQQIQRRQNYRVKCLLPIEVVGVLAGKTAQEADEPLNIRTVTTDLSAGGLSYRNVRKCPQGAQLNVKLSIPDGGPPISIPCSVIYSDYVSENQALYRTALRYIALTEGERARIVRFIYRTQLQSIHP